MAKRSSEEARLEIVSPGRRTRGGSLGGPFTLSILFHAAIVSLFFFVKPGPPPPQPPMYRVELIAAPPAPPAIGVVQPEPAPTPPPPVAKPTPVRPKTAPREIPKPNAKAPPRSRPQQATPTTPPETKVEPKTSPPAAGGGETGGRGADVANVNTGGIEFPFPGYLENIVRQIAVRFEAPRGRALRAEVTFLIRRDGSVPLESITLVTRSGVYSFDLDAKGAVEAAARANVFGPLPKGYPDDVLPVTFRFDPRLVR